MSLGPLTQEEDDAVVAIRDDYQLACALTVQTFRRALPYGVKRAIAAAEGQPDLPSALAAMRALIQE